MLKLLMRQNDNQKVVVSLHCLPLTHFNMFLMLSSAVSHMIEPKLWERGVCTDLCVNGGGRGGGSVLTCV